MIETLSTSAISRRGALALLGALALAACGSSQTGSSSSSLHSRTTSAAPSASASPAPAPCPGSALSFAYGGTQGATGHLEVTVALRNVSARRCTLRGYAGARLLDGAGHKLPVRVRRGGGFFPDSQARPRLVVLAPGARAAYGLSFATNNEYAGAHVCRDVAALLSRTPGATAWRRLSLGGGRPRVAPCGSSIVLSPIYAALRPPA